MRVRIEVEIEDQVFSIEQDNRLSGYSAVSPVGIVMFAECVGRMLATMSAGSDIPKDTILESFTRVVSKIQDH